MDWDCVCRLERIYVATKIACTNAFDDMDRLCRCPSAEAEGCFGCRCSPKAPQHLSIDIRQIWGVFRDTSNSAEMPASRRDTLSRAYKACLSCRKRKIRCNLGPTNQAPCQRCQRESRECVIPEERSWKRQHETPRGGPSSNSGLEVPHAGRDNDLTSYLTSTEASRAQQENHLETETRHTSAPARPSNAGLENTMVTTTVTNGNDALGLLFSHIRSGQTATAADAANGYGVASTSVEEPTQAQSHRPSLATPGGLQSVRVNDEVKNAWSSSKLGQMGWLRAHQVTSLIDS